MVGAAVRGRRLGCAVILWGEGRRRPWWEDLGEGRNAPTTFDFCFPSSPTDYFVDHMGDYEDVLASLETLNHSVLKAMGYTKKVSRCGQPWGSRA